LSTQFRSQSQACAGGINECIHIDRLRFTDFVAHVLRQAQKHLQRA
jgi:hypothetical protein